MTAAGQVRDDHRYWTASLSAMRRRRRPASAAAAEAGTGVLVAAAGSRSSRRRWARRRARTRVARQHRPAPRFQARAAGRRRLSITSRPAAAPRRMWAARGMGAAQQRRPLVGGDIDSTSSPPAEHVPTGTAVGNIDDLQSDNTVQRRLPVVPSGLLSRCYRLLGATSSIGAKSCLHNAIGYSCPGRSWRNAAVPGVRARSARRGPAEHRGLRWPDAFGGVTLRRS